MPPPVNQIQLKSAVNNSPITVAIMTTTQTIRKISNPVPVDVSNISIPPFNYIIYNIKQFYNTFR
jgi:hypothetical protein